jgi:flagellar hook assembly protein FlgD
VNGKTYNTMRIWGELCDLEGIEEQKPGSQAARPALDVAQNPFRSSATINFTLSKSGSVSLRIYDAGGRLVRKLAGGSAALGSHTLSWDGRDDRGNPLPSGLYFCTLRSADAVLTKKLVKLE